MYKIISKCPKYDFLKDSTDAGRIDELINMLVNFDYNDIRKLLNVDKTVDLMLVGKSMTASVEINGNVEVFRKSNNIDKIAKIEKSAKILMTPINIQDERFSICIECDHFIDGKCSDIVKDGKVEYGCNCLISSKIAIPISSCPINKWGTYNED